MEKDVLVNSNDKCNELKYCDVLGVNINVTNMKETVSYIEENIEALKAKYICVSNVHTTVMSYEDDEYKNIQNSGAMALPDGGPLSVVSRMRGFKKAQRVTGPDLMEEIFARSKEKEYKHFFYGSTNETLNTLKEKLNIKYPGISIVGIYSPPFREITKDEDDEIINMINVIKPDFVWVGLGAPKQEVWMYNHKDVINSLMIGVGAGFEYHANKIKRAPMWMQKSNLEWVYRLYQEPRRLWKRYFVTNFKFIYYILVKEKKRGE